ncbi:TetR/AcrR family transcriptional regulator [Microbacterium sulfonylureivorans]|uniref:TetR/AcrR family transcriptional regulator n=1 Tax=Microbacterium sulfonylureivorans TaxID=2486854 RepID=UPI000FDB6B4D|nr:TetR family transcriptional regulator [Microbacterium sulfonylureivorans]
MANDGARGATAARKPRLDRQTIVAGALELAETPGVAVISFRELGAHLGVDPTAMYRHFRSKDELNAALLEQLTEQALARVTAPPEDWRDRLRQLAHATLTEFERYPAIGVEAMSITTHGAAERRAIELMLDAFSRAGLDGEDLVRHYALLALHSLAGAANMARARIERGSDPEVAETWLDRPILADPREFPLLAAHAGELAALQDRELFAAGVELVIESAERAALAR